MERTKQGDAAAFEELFTFGCPKFISPVIQNEKAMLKLQVSRFV